MPIDPVTGSIITAGIGAITQGANAAATGANNRKARAFAKEMFDKQNARDLGYWHMQNEYNSPEAQMRRLKDAGLNPNMVYGNGAVANNASAPHASNAPSWTPEAPRFDSSFAQQGLSQYFDLEMRKAQTDNLKAQNTVIMQDAALRAAQTGKTIQDTARSSVETDKASTLLKYAGDMASAQLAKITAEGNLTTSENQRRFEYLGIAADKNARDRELNKLLQNKTISETQKTRIETSIAALEADLRKNGINSHDPIWARAIGQILSKYGITIK